MSRSQRFLPITLLSLAASACQASAPTFRVHHAWLEGAVPAPQRVLVLPAEVAILRMSTSALEPVPELSRRVSADLESLLAEVLPGEGLAVVALPELSSEERAALEEHVLMFEAAANGSLPMPAGVPLASQDGELWWDQVVRFELELGPGLAFLAQRTGATTAVVLAGAAIEPTGGRQALSVFGSLLGGYEQISATRLNLGFVDLASGAILWAGFHADEGDWLDGADALTEREDLARILSALLAQYPGHAEFRAASAPE